MLASNDLSAACAGIALAHVSIVARAIARRAAWAGACMAGTAVACRVPVAARRSRHVQAFDSTPIGRPGPALAARRVDKASTPGRAHAPASRRFATLRAQPASRLTDCLDYEHHPTRPLARARHPQPAEPHRRAVRAAHGGRAGW